MPALLTKNRLLLALPGRELDRLHLVLEQVHCERADILVDAESTHEHVYFPDNGVISIVVVYPDGSVVETATIGREGTTGFQAVFGAKMWSARFLVQLPAPQRAFRALPSHGPWKSCRRSEP